MQRSGRARPTNRYGRSEGHMHFDVDVARPRCDFFSSSGEVADAARTVDLRRLVRREFDRDFTVCAGAVWPAAAPRVRTVRPRARREHRPTQTTAAADRIAGAGAI